MVGEDIVQFPGAVTQLDTSLANVKVTNLSEQLWLATRIAVGGEMWGCWWLRARRGGELTSPRILFSHSCVKRIEATKLSSGTGLQVGEGVVLWKLPRRVNERCVEWGSLCLFGKVPPR